MIENPLSFTPIQDDESLPALITDKKSYVPEVFQITSLSVQLASLVFQRRGRPSVVARPLATPAVHSSRECWADTPYEGTMSRAVTRATEPVNSTCIFCPCQKARARMSTRTIAANSPTCP